MTRVLLFGFGEIAQELARLVLKRPELELAGAVDIDAAKVGRDIGELLGQKRLGIAVVPELAQARKADVVLHATKSRLAQVLPELLALTRAKLNIISSCEELVWPWHHHSALASALDRAAKAHGARIVGVGVNPGFVLDSLIVMLARACQEISAISATRTVDLLKRRQGLRRKMGLGLSLPEFERRAAQRELGHVGLAQSAAMICAALGWKLAVMSEKLAPLGKRKVLGVRQELVALADKGKIELKLCMVAGGSNYDAITIDGIPPIKLRISPGISGELATTALMVNSIYPLLRAQPGLRTVLELGS